MSLHVVPKAAHPTTHSTTTTASSNAVPGLADPLRSKLSSTVVSTSPSQSEPVTSSHPLETRLKNWTATQEQLKMESLRRTFGIAEPVRRGMEMKIVSAGEWKPACLGGSDGVGMDVLRGGDMGEIGWEDVYRGGCPILNIIITERCVRSAVLT
ncbi:MAG: hypothetical protein M1823_001925 [Watsoniomyces obsoletus]|nr:MAG: hypothetical protein M1823_001925 [Watsoniomyces obsoletus]